MALYQLDLLQIQETKAKLPTKLLGIVYQIKPNYKRKSGGNSLCRGILGH